MRTIRNIVLLFSLLSVSVNTFGTGSDSVLDQDHVATNEQRVGSLVSAAISELDDDPVMANKHAVQALKLAEDIQDPHLKHEALHCLAMTQHSTGLSVEFLQTALRALQLARSMGDARAMAQDLQHLSMAYLINADPEKALEEARNALALTIPLQDTAAVDAGYQFLLRTLLLVGKYDEVHQLADRALARVRSNGDELEEARTLKVIGECFIAQDQANNAMPYLGKALGVIQRDGSHSDNSELLLDLAEGLLDLGRFAEVHSALERAKASFTKSTPWEMLHRELDLRYQFALAEMRWKDAVGLLQKATNESDSVSDLRRDQRMAQLQVSYQLDRKELDNAMLREENAKHAALIQDELWNNRALLASLVILLSVVIGLFLTSRYSIRLAKRLKLKNELIKSQHNEICNKNMELERQNARLAESMLSDEEKEMMIKEIHHRAKNNLQVVDSLLQIQTESLTDPLVKRSLREAQGRIRSMGLVHEHIYHSVNGARRDLQEHLENLVRSILVAYGAHDRVSVQVNAELPTFESEILMPLTLVVNELFTNAIKYALVGSESGRISIGVRQIGTGYELLFSENGQGNSEIGPLLKERSFGSELVQMLAAQMNGELKYLNGQGTSVRLTFEPEHTEMRMAS